MSYFHFEIKLQEDVFIFFKLCLEKLSVLPKLHFNFLISIHLKKVQFFLSTLNNASDLLDNEIKLFTFTFFKSTYNPLQQGKSIFIFKNIVKNLLNKSTNIFCIFFLTLKFVFIESCLHCFLLRKNS